MSKLKRILPWVILISAIAIPLWLPAMARMRARHLTDTGKTRPVVNQVFAKLQAIQPNSLEDTSLRESLKEAVNSQYIASLWLFTPDGRIAHQTGSKADPARFYEWATQDALAIIHSVPNGLLTREQKGALMAVSALRGVGGGDHNDVFLQAVSPLKSPDGKLIGWLGANYDINPSVSARPTPKELFVMLLTLLLLAAYWLSIPAWVYLDARERGERAWVWTLFVLIGNLAALLAYVLVRTPPGQRAMKHTSQ